MLYPDHKRVSLLIMELTENEERYGLKYCPCRMITVYFEKDLKLVCPRNFKIQKDWREQGECYCSLFVKRSQDK